MGIGDRIKAVRSEIGLNQAEFSSAIGVTQGNLSRYEKMKQEPSINIISKMICEYNINAHWLLTGEGSMFRTPQTIGKRLKEARLGCNQQAETVAILCSVSLKEYKSYEEDKQEPGDDFLRRLEGNFNISSTYIRSGHGNIFTDRAGAAIINGKLVGNPGTSPKGKEMPKLPDVRKFEDSFHSKVVSVEKSLMNEVIDLKKRLERLEKSHNQPSETKDPAPEYTSAESGPASFGRPNVWTTAPEYAPSSELAPVPYLPGVAAGEPREAIFSHEVYWIDKDKIKHSGRDYAVIGIVGTSMTNAGIHDGDVALIHRERNLRSGQIYLVRYEGEYTLKRYIAEKGTEYLAYDDGSGRKVQVKPGDWEVIGIFCMSFKPEKRRIKGI